MPGRGRIRRDCRGSLGKNKKRRSGEDVKKLSSGRPHKFTLVYFLLVELVNQNRCAELLDFELRNVMGIDSSDIRIYQH